jgi:hypothetical protein
VVVKLGEVTPGWQPFAPEDQPTLKGAYRWQTELVPGDPKTLSASYAIEIPSKLELVGGNRREG